MSLHTLSKRDDDEFLLPKPIIVLLIMIGAIALTLLGYAIHSAFGFGQDNNGVKPMSVAQMEYMAEVKVRNLEALAREGRSYEKESRMGGRIREGESVY